MGMCRITSKSMGFASREGRAIVAGMLDFSRTRGIGMFRGAGGMTLPRGGVEMGSHYRHPALKQLKEQQARFAPRERRVEQIDRAETLLGEIDDERRYPYE